MGLLKTFSIRQTLERTLFSNMPPFAKDYNVKIEDGISSEASKRELLAVKLDQAEAAIHDGYRRTRASADYACVERLHAANHSW